MSYVDSIIAEIPSGLLREHLQKKPIKLSLLQWASVASMVIRQQGDLGKLFEEMLSSAKTDYQKALLRAAMHDIIYVGYVDGCAQRVYEAKHPEEEAPLFPFLERCYLPILLKKGDLTKAHLGNQINVFLVWDTPEDLSYRSDLTDECYYCYSLNCDVPEDLFLIHEHIHICFADACSEDELSDSQKAALITIRQKLMEKGVYV